MRLTSRKSLQVIFKAISIYLFKSEGKREKRSIHEKRMFLGAVKMLVRLTFMSKKAEEISRVRCFSFFLSHLIHRKKSWKSRPSGFGVEPRMKILLKHLLQKLWNLPHSRAAVTHTQHALTSKSTHAPSIQCASFPTVPKLQESHEKRKQLV